MDVHIRAAGLKVTDELNAFIERKMARLDRLAEHVTEANLELKRETLRNGGELATAQITLQTGRHILRAEERAPEATKAIDAAVDKLVRQVRKYNGKRADRRKRGGATGAVPRLGEHLAALQDGTLDDGTGWIDDDPEDGEDRIVRTKRFSMKPMNVEEAVDQMELLGHDFYLFQNADEDQLNVLYRRRDGSYGLLAPTTG